MTYTSAWSAIVEGLVRKKKASVMWKRETDVMIVFAEMSAIVAVGCLGDVVVLLMKLQGDRVQVRKLLESSSCWTYVRQAEGSGSVSPRAGWSRLDLPQACNLC
jgi:hypothetical protein